MTPSLTTFSFPTRTIFGPGAMSGIGDHLRDFGVQRPLLVTDAGLLPTPAWRRVEEATRASGAAFTVFSGVHPNPVEADVVGAAEAFCSNRCDVVIGVGGGSALDVAKAARCLVKRPGFALERFYETADWSDLAPFIAVPTTAGTGSEVGRSSVITLQATGRKGVLFHPALLARLVLLDPLLTLELPPHLTAATGADALTHCIESYTCPVFHPMCDGIALEGVRLVVEALPRAYRDGADVDARGRMLVAAAMGAVAFQKDLGVVHSMAHPLSTICGMHHGLANALCLVAGMRLCAARKPGLYRQVGLACGLDMVRASDADADQATVEFIRTFLVGLGLDQRLSQHGVRFEQLGALVTQAVEDPCHRTNAVPVTADDFRTLYREVM